MNEKLILSAVIFDSKVIDDKEHFFIMLIMLDPSVKGSEAVITETIFTKFSTDAYKVYDHSVNIAAGNVELDQAEARPNTQLFDFTGKM